MAIQPPAVSKLQLHYSSRTNAKLITGSVRDYLESEQFNNTIDSELSPFCSAPNVVTRIYLTLRFPLSGSPGSTTLNLGNEIRAVCAALRIETHLNSPCCEHYTTLGPKLIRRYQLSYSKTVLQRNVSLVGNLGSSLEGKEHRACIQ